VELCEPLEQHRRLTFEGHPLLHPEQSRRGVEIAAHARRRWRTKIALQHRFDDAGCALVAETARDLVCAAAMGERGRRHPPRLACSDIATGQPQRYEVPDPHAFAAVDTQQLPAPRFPVEAQADAIERDSKHGTRDAMLRRHRGDVRMMVLHTDARDAVTLGQLRGVARAEEIRMQVVRNQLGLYFEDRGQMLDRLDMRGAGRRVVEIADVLRDERLVASRTQTVFLK